MVKVVFTNYNYNKSHWAEMVPLDKIKERAEEYRISDAYFPRVDDEYKGKVTLTIDIDHRGVRYRIW